jgi:hypothetical protein
MTAGFTTQDSALERMSCAELAEVIRLQSDIYDAQRAGFAHWAEAMRTTLAALLATKTHRCPAILSVAVKAD